MFTRPHKRLPELHEVRLTYKYCNENITSSRWAFSETGLIVRLCFFKGGSFFAIEGESEAAALMWSIELFC